MWKRSFPRRFKVEFTWCVSRDNLWLDNPNCIIIGQLNINSVRTKPEMTNCIISEKTDVLLLSEIKIDATSPLDQFLIPGFALSNK